MTRASANDRQGVRRFAIDAARLLSDRHCEDVRLLDVRGLSQVCDYVLIASGTSARQMKSLAAEVADLGREHDESVFRSDRDEGTTWVIVDFVDLVVHLFEPQQRAYYDLEDLWSDAEVVDWPAATRRPARRDGPTRTDATRPARRRRAAGS